MKRMTATTNSISSRQLMEEIVARATIAMIEASKKENKGVDNLMLRELKGIHSNTTTKDLPEHLQKAVKEITDSMFGYMSREGFVLVPRETRK